MPEHAETMIRVKTHTRDDGVGSSQLGKARCKNTAIFRIFSLCCDDFNWNCSVLLPRVL